MKIFIGADHRGFSLKEEIKSYLLSKGHNVVDVGAFELNLDDDCTEFALLVANEVAKDINENRGILICGSGMGMDVVANKVKGIRATVAYSKSSAQHARSNDNISIISLAGDVLKNREAEEITTKEKSWPENSREAPGCGRSPAPNKTPHLDGKPNTASPSGHAAPPGKTG